MKKLIAIIATAAAIVCAPVFAANNSANSQKGGVSNIENQTSIYEKTTHGKRTAEWMKGKKVKPDCSPAMNRVGWSEGCKK